MILKKALKPTAGLFLSALLISSSAFANLQQAPQSINLSRSKKAIFVDFKTAKYVLTYDLNKKSVTAQSEVSFESEQEGYPIFDLIPTARDIKLNGEQVSTKEFIIKKTNGRELTKAKYFDKKIAPGTHKFTMTNTISKNISFGFFSSGVRSGFWTSDLSDRTFLEQYLPANFEYDQVKMSFEVKIVGTKAPYRIFANGEVKELSANHFSVDFPAYFTSSSLYFHLVPRSAFKPDETVFKSIDGREIPLTSYTKSWSNSAQDFTRVALKVLKELEKDYGPFPHNKIVIYGAGQGGMEYCGATITSMSALGHELIHSYFARGIMPARGNAGWVDEAVASWRDMGYRSVSKSGLSTTKMAGHSSYRRTTDRNAYTKGRNFIGHLDKRFSDQGGMKKFLKHFYEKRHFKPFLTAEFQQDLEDYFSTDLQAEFDKYIYGKNQFHDSGRHEHDDHIENPYHPRLTKQQLLDLL